MKMSSFVDDVDDGVFLLGEARGGTVYYFVQITVVTFMRLADSVYLA